MARSVRSPPRRKSRPPPRRAGRRPAIPIGHKGCHSVRRGGPGPAGAWLRSGSRPAARGRPAPPGPKRSLRERLAHLGHGRGTAGTHLGHIWGRAEARLGHIWGTSARPVTAPVPGEAPRALSRSCASRSQSRCPGTALGSCRTPGRPRLAQPVPAARPRASACGAPPLPGCGWWSRGDAAGAVGGAQGAPGLFAAGRRRRSGPGRVRGRGEPSRAGLQGQSVLSLSLQPLASWGAWRWSSCGGERRRGPASPLPISEVDFQDSIHVLGFSDELNKSLLQLYLDNRKEIRSILGELAPRLPSYHSLEWRLDVQLASRSLRQQIKPVVTMKLHLNQNEDQTAQVLQTDPATLLHLIQQLEQALGEMKMNHCRRIVRNMK
uniref:COMM domain containing 2 n=1 Tax=Taeniopygia guttata TaxID=59729 RepID=H0ZMD9_TAEGU